LKVFALAELDKAEASWRPCHLVANHHCRGYLKTRVGHKFAERRIGSAMGQITYEKFSSHVFLYSSKVEAVFEACSGRLYFRLYFFFLSLGLLGILFSQALLDVELSATQMLNVYPRVLYGVNEAPILNGNSAPAPRLNVNDGDSSFACVKSKGILSALADMR